MRSNTIKTAAELARKCGISASRISRLLASPRCPIRRVGPWQAGDVAAFQRWRAGARAGRKPNPARSAARARLIAAQAALAEARLAAERSAVVAVRRVARMLTRQAARISLVLAAVAELGADRLAAAGLVPLETGRRVLGELAAEWFIALKLAGRPPSRALIAKLAARGFEVVESSTRKESANAIET